MLRNFIEETANNPGTGAINLGGAILGRRSFAQEFTNGQTPFYGITDGTNAEMGRGTFVAGAPNVLQRTTVIWNSAGTTSPLNFTGDIRVFCELPASRVPFLDAAGDLILPQDPTAALAAATKQYVDARGRERLQAIVTTSVAQVEFIIPSTWQAIHFSMAAVQLASATNLALQKRRAGQGSYDATNYNINVNNQSGSSAPAGAELNGQTAIIVGSTYSNTTPGSMAHGVIETGFNSSIFGVLWSVYALHSPRVSTLQGGYHDTAGMIDRIRFFPSTGNITRGIFDLERLA